jgi:hypothetical protein
VPIGTWSLSAGCKIRFARIADLERKCGEGYFGSFDFVCAGYVSVEQTYAS